jgi:transcription termination factor Rho
MQIDKQERDSSAVYLEDIKNLKKSELEKLALEYNIEDPSSYLKQDLVFYIIQAKSQKGDAIFCSGVLEILPDNFGFIRSAEYNYMPSPDDIYVSPSQIRKFHLRTGDNVQGKIRPPKDSERYYALLRIEKVNNADPSSNRIFFENLVPLYPDTMLKLEHEGCDNISRIVDLFCPIGKGQRGLVVAPPRTGKTTILKKMAQSIAKNNPEIVLIVLLIDERPEEVTDMERSVNGEVISSTFDEPATRHVQVAEMVIEKSKRLIECGYDVVVLLDSITRLARAYNSVIPPSGKILSGGVDTNALHKPKRFFGAARNIENGGSLTIISTALVDTGSRMDEVIFEEFKGTGNQEMVLDRKLVDKRVFPAIDIEKSATRKEELLLGKENLAEIWKIRRLLSTLNVVEAAEFVKKKVTLYKTNAELLKNVNSS